MTAWIGRRSVNYRAGALLAAVRPDARDSQGGGGGATTPAALACPQRIKDQIQRELLNDLPSRELLKDRG